MPGQKELLDKEFRLNQFGPQGSTEAQVGTALIKEKSHILKASYDFAKQGGLQGTISLLVEDGKPAKLPSRAIVKDVLIDVLTAPTSGGAATIALSTGQAANDLKAATAIASYTGIVAGVPVGSAATSIKLTADRTPNMVVATADLTAGKFNVLIEYFFSD